MAFAPPAIAAIGEALGIGGAAGASGLTALGTGASEATLPTISGTGAGLTFGSSAIGPGIGSSAVGGLASTPELPTLMGGGGSKAIDIFNEIENNPIIQGAQRAQGLTSMLSMPRIQPLNMQSGQSETIPRRRVRMF